MYKTWHATYQNLVWNTTFNLAYHSWIASINLIFFLRTALNRHMYLIYDINSRRAIFVTVCYDNYVIIGKHKLKEILGNRPDSPLFKYQLYIEKTNMHVADMYQVFFSHGADSEMLPHVHITSASFYTHQYIFTQA